MDETTTTSAIFVRTLRYKNMAASIAESCLLVFTICKCQHGIEKHTIQAVSYGARVKEVFLDIHGPFDGKIEASCSVDLNDTKEYRFDGDFTIGCLKGFYPNIKAIKLKCCPEPEETEIQKNEKISVATKVNAFNILMSGAKVAVPKKNTCLNRKDELFNNVVEMMTRKKLTVHKSVIVDEGTYIAQVVTNALWYLTNHHQTINDAALRNKMVTSIPEPFSEFQGYNEVKRKKMKAQPLDQIQLNSHSEAVYSILQRPIFSSDNAWINFKTELECLAECMCKYKDFLNEKNISQTARQAVDHPARTVGSDISVEFHPKCQFVKEKYSIFDKFLLEKQELMPILFDENIHLNQSFKDNKERSRYFETMQLSVPVDLYKYCPGGSHMSIVFVAKVNDSRSQDEMLLDPIRVVSQIQHQLPEFHTRSQKRYFKKKLNRIASIKPSVIDFVYKELALDSSQVSHPETQERLRLISLGETGLVGDLRELNPGRPSDKFDVFFEKLSEVVESLTAVDDRRHGELHLSRWINLDEMILEAAGKCPDDTLIPSKSLVRLQFTPRNPYTHAALNFTGKIPVQYKIQRRQLRASHQDQHFCAALYKYLKSKAIELGKYGKLVCSDDKAKVPIGNPGLPISTGVRGKKTITPTSTELVAGDHDMHTSSLTPSVYLVCEVPYSTEKSFVSGKVHVAVNDSVLQSSNPFRHTVLLSKILSCPEAPNILLRYSDGGTDQRNTLESVKCASICLFRELDLDLMILARCAPGNSWVNPAERVMSILNLGLQNCALERGHDDAFKSANSTSQVREVVSKKPEAKEKWESIMEPVQAVVQNRFTRLSLKGEPFQIENPAKDDEIDHIKRHLRELFPDLDLQKLQKSHTKNVKSYQKWLDTHTRQRQYSFQIKKCGNTECCSGTKTPSHLLDWLPDPVLDQSKEHFKAYEDVKGEDTNDHDRPSYKPPQEKGKSNIRGVSKLKQLDENNNVTSNVDASVFTAQNARYSVECIECKKPRVIYCKNKLTDRQQMQLTILLSDQEYSCGSFITCPGNSLHDKVYVRLCITCETPVELAFYKSTFARADMCCQCGVDGGYIDEQLKKKFKTVLPICQSCAEQGFEPVHARPFGK